MTRLVILVEGDTEEEFTNTLLAPFFLSHSSCHVAAIKLGKARQRNLRGGIESWSRVKSQIVSMLKYDQHCIVSTFVDFFGMPSNWPNRISIGNRSAGEKAAWIELGMANDVAKAMGKNFNTGRFVPFIMMHEFEAIPFIDPKILARETGDRDLEVSVGTICKEYPNPEEINDHPSQAPSKRLEQLIPGYDKIALGNVVAIALGLPAIRAACPHFNEWIMRLETAVRG